MGYPVELRDVATNALYWEALAVDAEGHITQEKYGNATVTTRGYDPQNGRLNVIDARNALNQAVQYNTYGYDLLGNVTLRWDEGSGSASGDSLTYDALNRLTHTDNWTNGVQTVTAVAYDALGNITSKGGIGSYLYGGDPGCAAGNGAGPHAVCKAGTGAYTYDGNGNLASGGGRTLAWTSWNLPQSITQSGQSTGWIYDPEHRRVRMSAPDRTTWYFNPGVHQGGHYERTRYASGTVEHRHTLYGGGYPIGEVITFDGGAPSQTRYFHDDRQGSVMTVTDGSGAALSKYRYDPWGRRSIATGAATGIDATRQGHTEHEMLEIGLTHMNGRLYDAQLVRFVSADPPPGIGPLCCAQSGQRSYGTHPGPKAMEQFAPRRDRPAFGRLFRA